MRGEHPTSVKLPMPEAELAQTFQVLADQWYSQTAHLSLVQKMVRYPAYQRIIGMGWPVVPLILRELQARPHHWFVALPAITGEMPIPAGSDVAEMREAWLQWGRLHGFLGSPPWAITFRPSRQ